MLTGADQAAGLRQQVRDFLAGHDPAALPPLDFLRARFDAGLAWVHDPAGLGGQGLPRTFQAAVDAEFAAAGAPDNNPARIGMDFEEFQKAAATQIPVRRVGQPEDIANVTSFLASEGAGFLSGQVIYVAGGPLN